MDPIGLGHGVKGQDQYWHHMYKIVWEPYGLQFLPNFFFKFHMEVVDDEKRNPIYLWLRGQRSRSTLHYMYKIVLARYRLQFKSNDLHTSHASCRW